MTGNEMWVCEYKPRHSHHSWDIQQQCSCGLMGSISTLTKRLIPLTINMKVLIPSWCHVVQETGIESSWNLTASLESTPTGSPHLNQEWPNTTHLWWNGSFCMVPFDFGCYTDWKCCWNGYDFKEIKLIN